jgi:transposase
MSPELRAKIRRLFFAEHWKVGTIAKELGIHADTIKRVLETERMVPKRVVRPSMLDPYKGLIQDTLEKHPKLRATRLYAMLKARGYPGSEIQVRRYVRNVRPRKAEAYLRRETLPGEEAQVDWASFGNITVGHARRPLSCFVMVLGHSRAMYARFSLNQTMESFLRGHVAAFEAFGGVPRVLLYDNLKSAVLEREGDLIRFHPTLLEMAGHYHFTPKPCAVARGNEKGKVERTIQYVRHAFFEAHGSRSVAELNIDLAGWIEGVAHQRRHPTDPAKRSVWEVFKAEKPCLLPRPQHDFECALVKTVQSGKTPYIRFDQNDYSIPHDRVRSPLTLVADEFRLRFTNEQGEIIAEHMRSYDRGARIENEDHLEVLRKAKRNAKDISGRDKVLARCPQSRALFEALLERDIPLASQTATLNRLIDAYGADRVDAAIRTALEKGAAHAASVAHILEVERRREKRPPVFLDDKHTRDPVSVREHDLSAYDKLTQEDSDHGPF